MMDADVTDQEMGNTENQKIKPRSGKNPRILENDHI